MAQSHKYELKDIVQNGFITGRVKSRFMEDDKPKYVVEELENVKASALDYPDGKLPEKRIVVASESGLRRIQMQA